MSGEQHVPDPRSPFALAVGVDRFHHNDGQRRLDMTVSRFHGVMLSAPSRSVYVGPPEPMLEWLRGVERALHPDRPTLEQVLMQHESGRESIDSLFRVCKCGDEPPRSYYGSDAKWHADHLAEQLRAAGVAL